MDTPTEALPLDAIKCHTPLQGIQSVYSKPHQLSVPLPEELKPSQQKYPLLRNIKVIKIYF